MRADLNTLERWIQPESSILDLGCGDGTLLAHLQKQSGIRGYGIEINIHKVIKSIEAGINVIQTDIATGLSNFRDGSFDYVIMTHTLQAVHHPDKLLKEMLRVGRKSIVTFPNFGHWRCRLQIALLGQMPVTRHLPETWYETSNIHNFTLKDFEKLCSSLDIAITRKTVVDYAHKGGVLCRLFPNTFGELAIYELVPSSSI
ncbi:MAG: methionine biosynthesis protein MetW [Gammaproteobacteria bacterium]|nr:MAG: methionine biosynthesis protein MetW [Gammaproteobacteria bacterium]